MLRYVEAEAPGLGTGLSNPVKNGSDDLPGVRVETTDAARFQNHSNSPYTLQRARENQLPRILLHNKEQHVPEYDVVARKRAIAIVIRAKTLALRTSK